ncbi:TetR/AcrR family transcriptional regulator [Crassaminicella thermophila]|uniref:TetR/AcrR family transcriptional regulator n=1 Tax=Crassaminicella thermophila TaxID=2599308 RepID=A0A5C0SDG3_CRATE|nr:TetR/AcrR family transcriptional regulator [Crassaminicella thermophila]QEK11796.1 TetR/AcrR family transcriptional regulator [Crassaminicella thermophila]
MDNTKGKKQLIIEASIKMFCKKGFHKTKVSDIATEAGVGKGTIYEYFDSKKQLFIEMMEYLADQYYNKVLKVMNEEKNITNKFKYYILLEEKIMTKHGDLAQLFMQEAHSIGIDVHQIMGKKRKKLINLIANAIKEGIDKNIFRKINPYTAALTFMGSVHHILYSKIFAKDDFSKEINIEDLHDILLHGIKK